MSAKLVHGESHWATSHWNVCFYGWSSVWEKNNIKLHLSAWLWENGSMSIRILTGKELVCREAAGGFIIVDVVLLGDGDVLRVDWLPIGQTVERFTMFPNVIQ